MASAALALVVLAGIASPAEAGSPWNLQVEKEVVGTQAEPGAFQIEVECTTAAAGPEVIQIQLADGESTFVPVGFHQTRTVTETEDRGATSVTCACLVDQNATCDARRPAPLRSS